MTGLAVLSFENAKLLVEEHAPNIQVPWIFVKGSIFDFLGVLRTKHLFLARSLDRETSNTLQETLFVDGKPVLLPLPVGLVVVLPLMEAQRALDQVGTEMVVGWDQAHEIVRRFLDHLYAYSIFVVEARDGAEQLVLDKTQVNNLYLRIKTSAQSAQPAAAQSEGKKV